MTVMKEKVAVFCSARDNIDPDFLDLGYRVGRLLAINEYATLTGCSTTGLMGTVANGTYENGGYNVGVYPQELAHLEEPFPNVDELYVEEKLIDRQAKLVELADAIIILPGGTGTLYELFEVLTKKAVGAKEMVPVIIVNYKGFYDGVIKQIVQMDKEGTYDIPNTLYFARDENDILPILLDEMDELD